METTSALFDLASVSLACRDQATLLKTFAARVGPRSEPGEFWSGSPTPQTKNSSAARAGASRASDPAGEFRARDCSPKCTSHFIAKIGCDAASESPRNCAGPLYASRPGGARPRRHRRSSQQAGERVHRARRTFPGRSKPPRRAGINEPRRD
jgi:hypothetical protein